MIYEWNFDMYGYSIAVLIISLLEIDNLLVSIKLLKEFCCSLYSESTNFLKFLISKSRLELILSSSNSFF